MTASLQRRRERVAMSAMVLKESFRSFSANRNMESAATLAYYGFLSMMPLLLLAIFLLGLLLRSSEQVTTALSGALVELFPTFNTDLLVELQALAARKVWGLVSVAVLLWSMTPFAAAARSAVRRIFKTEHRLPLIKAKLLEVAAILVILVLFLGLVLVKTLIPSTWMTRAGGPLLPFLFTFFALSFVFQVLAPVRLARREWMAGAFTTTALFTIMRPAFGLLLHYNPDYGYTFGSLKAIFLLIVWVYYTFAALLFGTEVAANTRRREALLLRGLLLAGGAASARPALLERFARRLEAGEWLFREGEPGHELFVVVRGDLRLSRGGQELKQIGVGDYFGEMSMLLDAPRTAGAQALASGAEVIAVSAAHFDTLLRENPALVRRMLKEMAERLRATNERASAAR